MFKSKFFAKRLFSWQQLGLFSMLYWIGAITYAASTGGDTGTPGSNINTLSAETMLANIANQVPAFMRLVTAIAYVTGMYLIIQGVIRLKHFGESRTMMSQEHHLMGPIMMLVAGTMLLYLPTSVQVGLNTFFSEANPYAYVQQDDQWQTFINDCMLIIQLFGTIAFVRGLIMLSRMGHGQSSHNASLSHAMTYIIAGLFCINIYQFVKVILVTLGITF